MTARLRAAGAEVVELPAVEIELPKDRSAIQEALARLGDYGWLVFTSPSGAEVFFELMGEMKTDIRALAGVKLAVIGRATGEMFVKHGIYPDYMPGQYYAKDLGEGLSEIAKGERILILRAEKGSPELIKPLQKAGIEYRDIALYHTRYPICNAQTERVKKLLTGQCFDYVTFTSGSTVRGFMETLKPSAEMLGGFKAVCIGEETRKAASACGMDCITALIPTMDSLAECMKKDAGNI